MKRVLWNVAVALLSSVPAIGAAVVLYLVRVGAFRWTTEDIEFVAGIAWILVIPAAVVGVLVGIAYGSLSNVGNVSRIISIAACAVCGGGAMGVWAAHDSPHVSLRIAIESFALAYMCVAILVMLFAQKPPKIRAA